VNPAAEGKSYPEHPFQVSPERVTTFRGVFGETRDVVPPTFLTAAEFTVFPEVVDDPELGVDFARVLHTEQQYEWHRHLRAGETLLARARIAQARKRGGTGFFTIETTLRDERGDVVAVCRASMVERAG